MVHIWNFFVHFNMHTFPNFPCVLCKQGMEALLYIY